MKPISILLLAVLGLLLISCNRTQSVRGGATGSLSDVQNELRKGGELDLFLLIGQSNMAGRGIVEAQDLVPNARVLTLSQDGEWVPAVDPIHFDKPIAGVGPGRAFGIAVADAEPSVRVGLIPAAVGGSPIASWEPGAPDAATKTHPYDDALDRARVALKSGHLTAILWHQGESDSNATNAPLYREKLAALIDRLRKQIGNPDLPFLIGQLGDFGAAPWDEWKKMVDAAQRSIAEEMHGVYFVSAEGLTDKGDALHFSAASARELGRRFAEAYLASMAGEDSSGIDYQQ